MNLYIFLLTFVFKAIISKILFPYKDKNSFLKINFIFNIVWLTIISILMYGTLNAIIIATFGLAAVFCEYSFNFFYRHIHKTPLYLYDKNDFDINQNASWINFPYYWGGYIFIFEIIKIIDQYFVNLSFQKSLDSNFRIFILLIISLCFVILYTTRYIKQSVIIESKFNFVNYIAYPIIPVIIFLIISYILTFDINIFIIFIFSSIFGVIGEAILGVTIYFQSKRSYHHWIYYQFPIIHKFSSIIIAPLWGIAGILIFYWLSIFN